MKMYNIYEITKNEKIGDLLTTVTEEQLEYFKKEKEGVKLYIAEKNEYIDNLSGYDFCVIYYEPNVVFIVKESCKEIAVYKTKREAIKRMDNEIHLNSYTEDKKRFSVISRHQTLTETL